MGIWQDPAQSFANHPERSNRNGSWKKEKSYKYNLRAYSQKSMPELEGIKDDMRIHRDAYSVQQVLAMRDIMEAMKDDRASFKEQTEARDILVKTLYGTKPFLDEADEGVSEDKPTINIQVVNGGE